MAVLVIYNPVSGDRSSKALFDQHVLPLLAGQSITPDKVIETERSGHAGIIVSDFLTSVPDGRPVSVILGSGDGTLHELINTLNAQPSTKPLPRIHLALVPCGTANALYYSLFPPSQDDEPIQHKLKSVQAFASGQHASLPLHLALSVLSAPPVTAPGLPPSPKQVSMSAVVTSTALHASILHDSEALRASDPTIQRFKAAARQNIARWYSASVKLYPHQGAGVVQVYDPATKTWIPHEQSIEDDPIVDLNGPFSYFLSTINVDRLEPTFRISPRGKDLLSTNQQSAAIDLIIVRPMRDPSYQMDSEAARAAFAAKAAAVLGAAYDDGAHVALRYDQNGRVVMDGNGPTVVEYLRCGAWEWEPDDLDGHAHLVCSDGDILTIPTGGKATCTAVSPMDDTAGFSLYV